MKIGSLAVCINNFNLSFDGKKVYDIPKKGKIYTVREIEKFNNNIGIRLEKIQNPIAVFKNKTGECAFNIERFREIDVPDNINEIIEELLMENA